MPRAISPVGGSATSRSRPKTRLVHAARCRFVCVEYLAGLLWTLARLHEMAARKRYTFLTLNRTSYSPRFRTPMPTTVVAPLRTERGNLVQGTRTIIRRSNRPGPFQDRRGHLHKPGPRCRTGGDRQQMSHGVQCNPIINRLPLPPRKKRGAACLRRQLGGSQRPRGHLPDKARAGGCATMTLPSGNPYAVVANPPSTGMTAPQTKLLARDARYSAIPAISSGAPMRFIGASSMTWREPCSSIEAVIFDGK